MSALREIFARFGVKFDTDELRAGDDAISATTDSLGRLGQALTSGLAALGIASFVEHTVQMGTELDRTSRILGVSSDAIQAWGVAAQRVGLDLDRVTDAFSTLQERARDATLDPKSDPALQLRQLGVEARGANGELKDGETLMVEVARGLATMGTQTDRVGAAMTLFGDVGRELLPVLQRVGAEGVEPLRAELAALGGGLSGEFVEAAREASLSAGRLETATDGLRSQIGVVLLPILARGADVLTEAATALARMGRESKLAEAAVAVLGAAAAATAAKVLIAFAPLVLQIGAAAAGVLILTLVVEDLLTTFDGGDSIFNRFNDSLRDFFDMNREQSGFIGDLAREWESYVLTVERAIDAVAQFFGASALPDTTEYTTQRGLTPPGAALEGTRGDREVQALNAELAARRRSGSTGQFFDYLGSAGLTTPGAVRPEVADEIIPRTTVRGLQPPPSVTQNVTVSVTAQGPDARAVAREAAREVRREIEASNREATDAFVGEDL